MAEEWSHAPIDHSIRHPFPCQMMDRRKKRGSRKAAKAQEEGMN
jgi:hypothetical protein